MLSLRLQSVVIVLSLTILFFIVLINDSIIKEAVRSTSNDDTSEHMSNGLPNIIFIVGDDHGWHDVGYHGSLIATPVLDWLAEDGLRLENYYVQPMCSPTRSQLLSGRYQIHTGLQHNIIHASQPDALPLDSMTLADKLQEAGYKTHAVGKWHVGFYTEAHLPTNRGFQTFFGFLTSRNDYYNHTRCYGPWCGLDLMENTEPVFGEKNTYSTHLFTQKSIDIIKRHMSKENSRSSPIFLYLAYQAVHIPLQVPREYSDRYLDIPDVNRRTYAGMVSCMDEGIGNVTRALRETGLWENTILVYTTDNGGRFIQGGNNWPLRGYKATLWEGGVRGVGLIHSKRFFSSAGRLYKNLMHVSDWLPTLVVGVANGNLNGTKDIDGVNQWSSLLYDLSNGPRTELLHNIDPMQSRRGPPCYSGLWDCGVRAAVRVGHMKLITGDAGEGSWIPPPEVVLRRNSSSNSIRQEIHRFYPASTSNVTFGDFSEALNESKNIWLFNITEDPEERNDMTETHHAIVIELLTKLKAFNDFSVPARYPQDDPNCNPANLGGAWRPWL